MEITKKFLVYAMLLITLVVVGCEGGCSQDSPTSPDKSSASQ